MVVLAQTRVEGILLNSQTNQPISFANIFLNNAGIGTSSNSLGEFELILPRKTMSKDSVTISCIGFQTQTYSITQLQKKKAIYIHEKTIELEEFLVLNRSYSVKDILRITFGKIAKNSYSKPYQLHTFYRHYCSEKGIYGRLIEAAVTLYDTKGHKSLYKNPNSKMEVKVSQIRRSFDYTKNFDEHDAISIYSTIKHDISSYEKTLHSYPNDWGFKLIDTTFYNGSYVWVIQYNYTFTSTKNGIKFNIDAEGKIYISIADFAIIRIIEKQSNELLKEYEKHSYLLEWEVNYRKYMGNYFLSYVKESGWNIDEKLGNDKEIVSKKDHRFHVEIMVNAIVLDGFQKFKGKEPTAEEIKQIQYNPNFWKDYNVLKSTPLNNKIISDLERKKSLDQQYED